MLSVQEETDYFNKLGSLQKQRLKVMEELKILRRRMITTAGRTMSHVQRQQLIREIEVEQGRLNTINQEIEQTRKAFNVASMDPTP